MLFTYCGFVFMRKTDSDNAIKHCRIFAQATCHDMSNQATKCCINSKETGSMLRRQALERSHKMSATTRKSAEVTRSSGGLVGIVSGMIHIASLRWCRKLARYCGASIAVALPTSLRGMRTQTTC